MSTSASSPSPAAPFERILAAVDPRLRRALADRVAERVRTAPPLKLAPDAQVVLVGHRAAGKTTLLPHVAELLGRPAIDLDAELARRHGRSLREWLEQEPSTFRAAERALFVALPKGSVVAAGGGFLSLHADLLEGHFAVEIPVSFETYCERLRGDLTRPRLRPELPLEDELREVFAAREDAHRRLATVPLEELLATWRAGQ